MALNTQPDALNVSNRFGIAQDAPIASDIEARRDAQILLRAKIYEAAKFLAEEVATSREQSLALTKLEEALLWGGKAIFA